MDAHTWILWEWQRGQHSSIGKRYSCRQRRGSFCQENDESRRSR
jgi:hypothetical protein